ncbi:hypothetical protein VSX61_18525 [Brenneria populi subsp. brevivirga]|nr:hypothetical protein [Brenneria populi subsp. brevivirga]
MDAEQPARWHDAYALSEWVWRLVENQVIAVEALPVDGKAMLSWLL